MNQIETKDRIRIELDTKKPQKKWIKHLVTLGEFLLEHSSPDTNVQLYAHEGNNIGGLRISEISFTIGRAGSSYQRSIPEHFDVIHACEEFLETIGEKPFRPKGWESCINDHGEAKCTLLKAMGQEKEAEAEYQKQLVEEAKLAA
jgi:hypothetical protein